MRDKCEQPGCGRPGHPSNRCYIAFPHLAPPGWADRTKTSTTDQTSGKKDKAESPAPASGNTSKRRYVGAAAIINVSEFEAILSQKRAAKIALDTSDSISLPGTSPSSPSFHSIIADSSIQKPATPLKACGLFMRVDDNEEKDSEDGPEEGLSCVRKRSPAFRVGRRRIPMYSFIRRRLHGIRKQVSACQAVMTAAFVRLLLKASSHKQQFFPINTTSLACFFASSTMDLAPDTWLADTGANTHITNNKDLFQEGTYYKMDMVVSTAKGESSLHIRGAGTVVLPIVSRDSTVVDFSLSNIVYTPNASCSLLSVSTLCRKAGLRYYGDEHGLSFCEKGSDEELIYTPCQNSTYVLRLKKNGGTSHLAPIGNSPILPLLDSDNIEGGIAAVIDVKDPV